MEFNKHSRTTNAFKTSIIGGLSIIIKIVLGFVYRTLFLWILSEVYLGINGLFTNILQILSLTELGITTAIVYRFYKPISENDVYYVGMLMNFFKRVYLVIAGIIMFLGLLIMPFIRYLINDKSEIPNDVNIYVIYILFLANTLSTYVFSYKITLLSADQKNYKASIIDLISTMAKYGFEIAVLFVTHNYTATLAIGIIVILLVNLGSSIWVSNEYHDVFAVKDMLPREEQKKIFNDTKACLCHKVGYTILTGTDNAILTKMVSLAATGVYSNYSMIITYIQNFLTKILGDFTSSVGNALNEMDDNVFYKLFKKMNCFGLWIASVVTICVYIVVDDFIQIWLGENFILGGVVTIVLCIQMYIIISRIIHGAFINAAGLFAKDKIRPFIEATLNLLISIVLAKTYGIAGVFIGTIVSTLLTSWWREPYILFRFLFKRSIWEYWKIYGEFTLCTLAISGGLRYLKYCFTLNKITLGFVFGEGLTALIISNLLLYVIMRKNEEVKMLLEMIQNKMGILIKK